MAEAFSPIMVLGTFVALEHVGIDLTALAAVSAVLMVGKRRFGRIGRA